MSITVIPTNSARTHYTQETLLDGVAFQLGFAWNARQVAWYMSLRKGDGTSMLEGIRLVVGMPLLRKLEVEGRPLGDILALAEATQDVQGDPGRYDLGDRVKLYYFDGEELGRA